MKVAKKNVCCNVIIKGVVSVTPAVPTLFVLAVVVLLRM